MKDLEIKNWPPFERTVVQDLGRINLFGGPNNIGKSRLLDYIRDTFGSECRINLSVAHPSVANGDYLATLYHRLTRDERFEYSDFLQSIMFVGGVRHEYASPGRFWLQDDPDGGFRAIHEFGRGVQAVARMGLEMIDAQNGIYLIDDIEHGLHHSCHRKFWVKLFHLARVANTQIFATTHSREMLEAFAEVASRPDLAGEGGAYFELARSARTGRIVAPRRRPDILAYSLKCGIEVRGQEYRPEGTGLRAERCLVSGPIEAGKMLRPHN